ncbi:unnamed protein product [Umbelopsis ramanniana]
MQTYTAEQVAAHNNDKDCWIIVDNKVFDVTKFLSEHPGGKKILLKVAGKDASKQFAQFHNAQIMENVGLPLQVGVIGGAVQQAKPEKPKAAAEAGNRVGDMIPYGDPTDCQDWNSPYYNESHYKLRRELRAFVEKELMPNCHMWSENKEIPREVIKKCAEFGILGAACGHVPEEYLPYGLPAGINPKDWDAFHEMIVIDEIARCGSGGLLWGLQGGLSIGLPPVLLFGSKYLQDKITRDCLAGDKRICLGITEPHAGSDVAGLKTEAKDMGDYYLVNGEKKWITQGLEADYFTVACRTGGNGMAGVSLLLIERSMPGVTTRKMDVMGMFGSGTSYITFEDVKVPKSNLIGKENDGFKYIMYNFNHERLGIIMQATRLARVCTEEAFKYANKRMVFGKKLIDQPVIRNKLGHMVRQVEATHAWLESTLYQINTMPAQVQPLRLGGPIALLKAQSTQTFEFCAREAAQIFGGLSYTRGGQGEKIERLYREVRAYAIPGGSEEIMLDLGVRQAQKVAALNNAKL